MHEADTLIDTTEIDLSGLSPRSARGGSRGRSTTHSRTGRYVRAAPVEGGETPSDIAIDATLRAAALRHASSGQGTSAEFSLEPGDLRTKVRSRMCNTLVVFVVDASDSMGSGERLAAAKGAALALLETAYQKRDRVALVAFEGESAEVLLPPTTSTDLAREHLRQLPTGGATPFADGLLKAWQLVRTARLKDPEVEPVLVILSDGEANIPLAPGQSVLPELLDLAGKIRQDRIGAVAIDSTKGSRRSPEMLRLAEALGADYHRIDRLKAKNVVEVVRSIGGEV